MSEKMIEFEVCGRKVEFVCDSRDTRSGFAHDATIIINWRREREATCHYLNRTWEAWRFQSVCLACVNSLIAQREYEVKEDYKRDNGLTRIVGAKRKTEVNKRMGTDDRIIFLKEIKRILNEKSF